jgi:hypothetical protein
MRRYVRRELAPFEGLRRGRKSLKIALLAHPG